MMERSDFINLVRTSMIAKRPDFARSTAADWLATWPKDIEFQLLLAKAEIEEGLIQKAVDRLRGLIEIHPEYCEAYQYLHTAYDVLGDSNRAHVYKACFFLLQRVELESSSMPSWILALDNALQAMERGNHRRAISKSLKALEADPDLALPTLITTKAYSSANKNAEALHWARSGHDRWPDCLYFRLMIAMDLIDTGKVSQGVELLHKIAGDDPAGFLVPAYLDRDHVYGNLWLDYLTGTLSRPIPSEVAALMGNNRITQRSSASEIPSATLKDVPQSVLKMPELDHPMEPVQPPVQQEEVSSPPELPEVELEMEAQAIQAPSSSEADESIQEAEKEFQRIADRLKVTLPKDKGETYQPAYIVLSNKKGLQRKFGADQFQRLDDAILNLVRAVRKRPGWSAYQLYVDDPASTKPFEIAVAEPSNPWEIKLRLTDLDKFLKGRQEMIGSVLIVGGNEIIPFHMLPNPTDDDDDVIPSDNPYTTTDANYFAPEWPLGRFPSDNNIDLLTRMLISAAEGHRKVARQKLPLRRWSTWLMNLFHRLLRARQTSMGYSASIWRKASLAVFRTIGNPRSMFTSPPIEAGSLPAQAIRPMTFSYYNLHGLEGEPEWFGQRDPFDSDISTEDFPIALRPEDIVNGGRAPQVIFTEACYGANILQKSVETAICLRFLDQGSKAIIGSTKISYGSVTPPLIAADLLGRFFWEGLKRGLSIGEALRQGKLKLATEMHRRQGYLDGEDQKTLISFILYGDPLYTPNGGQSSKGEKRIIRQSSRPAQMKTTYARGGPVLEPEDLEPLMLSKVRSIVTSYLPGMADAVCKIHPQMPACIGSDHACPTHQLNMTKTTRSAQSTFVVTLSKQIPDGKRRHPHFARLTLDEQGKILKLAVSR